MLGIFPFLYLKHYIKQKINKKKKKREREKELIEAFISRNKQMYYCIHLHFLAWFDEPSFLAFIDRMSWLSRGFKVH